MARKCQHSFWTGEVADQEAASEMGPQNMFRRKEDCVPKGGCRCRTVKWTAVTLKLEGKVSCFLLHCASTTHGFAVLLLRHDVSFQECCSKLICLSVFSLNLPVLILKLTGWRRQTAIVLLIPGVWVLSKSRKKEIRGFSSRSHLCHREQRKGAPSRLWWTA